MNSSADSMANALSAMHDRLRDVKGWLYDSEAEALFLAVVDVPDVDEVLAVEIGSWMGKSTIAMASAVQHRGGGTVVAVDPHADRSEHALVGVEDSFPIFEANLRRAGVDPFVKPVRDVSLAARPTVADHSVHVLFVDGSHEYEDVVDDIKAWESALADGATVAFNDISHPGVLRALRELVLRSGSPYRRPRLVANTLFLQFAPGTPWTPDDERSLKRVNLVLRVRPFLARPRRFLPMPLVRLGHRAVEATAGSRRG